MKLAPIFANEDSGEGLYAIRYEDEVLDEFERLFTNWNDTEYLENYCDLNNQYLETEYFDDLSIDEIITKIQTEAEELENRMLQLTEEGLKQGDNLQMLFKPLHNEQYNLPALQETKALIKAPRYPKPILRVYGIRIGPNTIVITGGAIKLTKTMEEHPDTVEELKKIEKVKAFLKLNNITIEDDIIYYYEQFEK